jgi:hypothetical protein
MSHMLTHAPHRGSFFNRTFRVEVDDGDATTFVTIPVQVEYHPVRNTPSSAIFLEYNRCARYSSAHTIHCFCSVPCCLLGRPLLHQL